MHFSQKDISMQEATFYLKMIRLRSMWTFHFQVQSLSNFNLLLENQYKSQPFLSPSCLKFYSKSKDLTVHRINNCSWATLLGQHQRTENTFCPLKDVLRFVKSHCSFRGSNSSVWAEQGQLRGWPRPVPLNLPSIHATGKQCIMRQMAQTQRPEVQ